jgi:hypothetical protein
MPGSLHSRVTRLSAIAVSVAVVALTACESELAVSSVRLGVCVHIDGSRYECPDSQLVRFVTDVSEIASVSLAITTSSGEQFSVPLPERTDAVFLTPNAIQILVEHYTVAGDSAKADELRRFIEWLRQR